MKSNCLALDRWDIEKKLKKSAARGFYFASNRKSLPSCVIKLKGRIVYEKSWL